MSDAREVVARALFDDMIASGFQGVLTEGLWAILLGRADRLLAALAADPGVIERAARALIREQSNGLCEYGKVCVDCDCFPEQSDAYALAHARAALSAALTPEGLT